MNDILISKINYYIQYSLEYNVKINFKTIYNYLKNSNLDNILNYYVDNINKNVTQNKYKNIIFITNTIYNSIYNCNKIIKNEANIIADDLLVKISYKNISIPINLMLLKEYSISSNINKKDFNKIISLIIIKFSIFNFLLKL